jgi:Thiamine pyrophosphate enzyme, C-terminal TPP binding domain/Carbohydrate-selective porin, OprB family
MRVVQGWAGKLLLLACAASSISAARAQSRAVLEETLVGPDTHEANLGGQEYLLGDWGGMRTRLLERGVRFDFFYMSDSLWGLESQQKGQFASWNRFRGTIDVDFGALAGLKGWYFHATALTQGGGNLGEDLGLLTGPSGMASASTTRLDSWWIEKRWLDDHIIARIGQFAGQDFYGVQHHGASFIFEPMGYALGNLFTTFESFDPFSTPAMEIRVVPFDEIQALSADLLAAIAAQRKLLPDEAAKLNGTPIHPLRLIHELKQFLTPDTTACLDMGSFHLWIAHHFYSFRPRQVLITNGQQTLGVALPWAIAAALVRPSEKILSISGDGGFLFSAMELETAVRLKVHLVHLVWIDGTYDMVGIQEQLKYGRKSGVDFGPIDYVKYAESFGAHGLMIKTPEEIAPVMKKAFDMAGPVIVGVHVNYADNHRLFEMVRGDSIL